MAAEGLLPGVSPLVYLEVHQLVEPRGAQPAAEGARRVVAAAVAGERACVPGTGLALMAPARRPAGVTFCPSVNTYPTPSTPLSTPLTMPVEI